MKRAYYFRWVVAMLTLMIVVEWLFWPQDYRGLGDYTHPEPPPNSSIADIEWRLPSMSVYGEIAERPLFAKSRRSP
jgi:hypothetical protein